METALIGWQLRVSTRLSNLRFNCERRVSELVFHFPNYHCKLIVGTILKSIFRTKKDIESFFFLF